MDPLISDAFKAAVGAGPVAGLLFYFLTGTKRELAEERQKTATLQAQIVSMLQAQIESEPKRRETLDGLKRLVEDQSAALKERLAA